MQRSCQLYCMFVSMRGVTCGVRREQYHDSMGDRCMCVISARFAEFFLLNCIWPHIVRVAQHRTVDSLQCQNTCSDRSFAVQLACACVSQNSVNNHVFSRLRFEGRVDHEIYRLYEAPGYRATSVTFPDPAATCFLSFASLCVYMQCASHTLRGTSMLLVKEQRYGYRFVGRVVTEGFHFTNQ